MRAAVDASVPLGTKAYVDGFTDPHHLCADCAAIVEAWVAAYRAGTLSPEEPSYSESAVCFHHINEWYRATGLGELSLAVAEARKRRAELEADHDAALEEQGKARP